MKLLWSFGFCENVWGFVSFIKEHHRKRPLYWLSVLVVFSLPLCFLDWGNLF